ncbi:MAG: AI-2E family transporter [Sterolibacterium sp.]|nr:AI-2E family transporter [Sterolibacterium sp.]
MNFRSDNPTDHWQTLLWSGCGLALLWLLYVLSSILTPFLLAGILAYICAPLVDWLVRYRLPRTAASLLVILSLGALLALLGLILLPLIREESQQMMDRLPALVALWNEHAMPWLQQHLGVQPQARLDAAAVKRLLSANPGSVNNILHSLLQSLKIGGLAVVGLLTTLALMPMMMFYLLADWHQLLGRLDRFIPRPWHTRSRQIGGEIDAVMGEFLRGQISVMLCLAVYYSLGLWLAGVSFALPVGILTGLLIFIPYIGFGLGLLLAILVALLQSAGIAPLIGVAIVYGFGQLLESFVLTPWLVGQRIGLHPLAVIFALLAFGQIFGFFGILLALPASAILLVGLRHLAASYLDSRFYRGESNEGCENDAPAP